MFALVLALGNIPVGAVEAVSGGEERKAPLATVMEYVREDFSRWAERRSREGTEAYYNRLARHSAEVFDSLCFVCINDHLSDNMRMAAKGKYDVERGGIGLEFFYLKEAGSEARTSQVEAFWHVSPKELSMLGDRMWNYTYAKGIFLENGDLYPSILHLVMSSKSVRSGPYRWDIRIRDNQPFQIRMADVVEDYSLSESIRNHVFDYKTYCANIIWEDELIPRIHELEKKFGVEYYTRQSPVGTHRIRNKTFFEVVSPTHSRFYTHREAKRVLLVVQERLNKQNRDAFRLR